MEALLAQLIQKVVEPVVFQVVMKLLGRWGEDPEFQNRCKEVYAKAQTAQTPEEKLNAAEEIQKLYQS